ncbi:YrrS family protein [Gracilibacillus sp. S3-1-1]|uniref:YrrS family protein n=1 Tax=Gracilibacillus pellucidus TaxID=3095368 RepID=A0ACC6M4P9_9BACI|nr:YrrS family protein [Gracilibacillus sp. S3-1-1]MDX8045889.1 YrrS family protein [Gracilibacillus sp. S3-1-1]
MADDNVQKTRRDRFEKKRTNTKAITWLSIAGGILVILIISLIVFGGKGNDEPKLAEDADEYALGEQQNDSSSPGEEENDELEVREVEPDSDDANQSGVQLSEVDPTDSNVRSAYEGNWQPIGTEQSEPHTTVYDNDSVDRQEMARAVELVTEIPVEQQVTWRAERAGEQSVHVVVSHKENQDDTYRVTLNWMENQGWQPVLLEELIENTYR